MRDYRSVLHILGLLLCIESVAMLIPMFIDILYLCVFYVLLANAPFYLSMFLYG